MPALPEMSPPAERERLRQFLEETWRAVCPAGSRCSCLPRPDAFQADFSYRAERTQIIKHFMRHDDGTMLLEGRESAFEIVEEVARERCSAAQQGRWSEDKRAKHNELLAVANAPGFGKSAFLAQIPKYMAEIKVKDTETKVFGRVVGAAVTLHSTMSDVVVADSVYPLHPLGLRTFCGALAAMRPASVDSLCLFTRPAPWRIFKQRIMAVAPPPLHGCSLQDYTELLRDMYRADQLVLLVDELIKIRDKEKPSKADELLAAEWVCNELGAVIDCDPATLVVVSSLSPGYAKALVTNSQRRIRPILLGVLDRPAAKRVAEAVLLPALRRRLAQTDAEPQLEELVARTLHFAGGHARSLEMLMEELQEGTLANELLDRARQGSVHFGDALTIFKASNLDMPAGSVHLLDVVLRRKPYQEMDGIPVGGQRHDLLRNLLHSGVLHAAKVDKTAVTPDMLPGSLLYVLCSGVPPASAGPAEPLSAAAPNAVAAATGPVVRLQAWSSLPLATALCTCLSPEVLSEVKVAAPVQEAVAAYFLAFNILMRSGCSLWGGDAATMGPWHAKHGDRLALWDCRKRTEQGLREAVEDTMREASGPPGREWSIFLLPAAYAHVDLLVVSPSKQLLGVQVKGTGLADDRANSEKVLEKAQESRRAALRGLPANLRGVNSYVFVAFFQLDRALAKKFPELQHVVDLDALAGALPLSLLSLALAAWRRGQDETT